MHVLTVSNRATVILSEGERERVADYEWWPRWE